MRLGVAVVMLLAGCRQLLGIDSPAVGDAGDDASSSDAATDSIGTDAPIDAKLDCLGTSGFEVCFVPSPGGRALQGTLNTDTSSECASPANARWGSALVAIPPACFVVGETITISSLSVVGSRSLVLVATMTITLTGLIDAGSYATGTTGPGAPWTGCPAFPTAPGSNINGAGGGAGASMQQVAGMGGGTTAGGAAGGTANAASPMPTFLHAGCHGQGGGVGTSVNGAGAAGRGGGALYLLARVSIGIAGTTLITVSGSGGGGSAQQGGGGGGGSAGVLVLAAPAIDAFNAKLIANGGGGAGGSTATAVGANGSNPPIPSLAAAPGGAGGDDGVGSAGGDGANGGAASFPGAGVGGSNGGAGGGGGGATGFILSTQSLAGVVASPAVTILP